MGHLSAEMLGTEIMSDAEQLWKRLARTLTMAQLAARGTIAPTDRNLILLACGVYYFCVSFVAWGWPALDGYPAIERWLDPSFLPSDFYTNTTQGYGVDTWQAWLFGSIQRGLGVDYALQIAVLTALRHFLWPLVLYRFFKALLHDEATALLGLVLGVVSSFAMPRTLGWSWVWGDGSPAVFAIFFAVLAWTELLNRRPWVCFPLLAVATIVQPLVGVHGCIFVATIFLFDYSNLEKAMAFRRPENYLAAFVFFAVFAWQYLLLSPSADERLPIEEYVRILAWERHPGDFLPSHFAKGTWIAFAIAAIASLIMLVRIWSRLPRRALIVGGLAVYAGICIVGYFFVELWPVRMVVDLIPYRTVAIGAPLMLAIIACFTASELRANRWISSFVVIMAFALAGSLDTRIGSHPIAAAFLLLAAAIAGLATSRRPGQKDTNSAGIGINLILRLAIPGLLVAAIPFAVDRLPAMTLPHPENQHPVYLWSKKYTPGDARFLVEQFASDYNYGLAISPQLMRLVGRRAVIASRDYPFRDSDARSWLTTWIVGLDHGRYDRVESASAMELRSICRSLPYDYVLRQRPLPPHSLREVARFNPTNGIGVLHVYRSCS